MMSYKIIRTSNGVERTWDGEERARTEKGAAKKYWAAKQASRGTSDIYRIFDASGADVTDRVLMADQVQAARRR